VLLLQEYTHLLVVQNRDTLDRATLNKLLNHPLVALDGLATRVAENSIGDDAYGNHSPKPHEVETWPLGWAII
jgi:hypothetical protein